ncbi:flavin-containing monooxygenase [Nocardia carnea]|uniref:flavin-containing monooxygenase n=1 Tax=Nocardia carnea TaxID=37328 RepID=UPI0024578CB5|nr:NAD(P)/FAD-dependent oxidoreductase [Nocardia carnea]
MDAIVVGAGFSGLYMVYELKKLGLSVQGIEAGDDVGGTWYWNRYPGVRTDSEARFYAYTINSELAKSDWNYSEKFPEGAEVREYLGRVADRFDIRSNFRFSTTVLSADYDEDTGRWIVRTDPERSYSAKYFVSAAGILSAPVWPDYPGLDSFAGTYIHASRWPKEGIDYAGKKVAIIGTGSTGVQLLPQIAMTAEKVTVFQRTANYVLPGVNASLTGEHHDDRVTNIEAIREGIRESALGMPYALSGRLMFDHTPEEQQRILEEGWQKDGFRFSVETFDDILSNPDANKIASDFLRNKIREIVKDPETAELLCPDYAYGVKRQVQGLEYLEAYNRDNVELVNIRETPITTIAPTGIQTSDALYEADIIVFAIGFDAATGSVLRLNVTGRDGLTLAEKWKDGLRTYMSMTVHGFPNFFMILGPQAPTGNMPSVAEGQGKWIAQLIERVEEKGADLIEASAAAEAEWTDHVNDVVGLTLIGTEGVKANSWFLGKNIKGRAESIVIYMAGYKMFFDRSEEIASMDYEGLNIA